MKNSMILWLLPAAALLNSCLKKDQDKGGYEQGPVPVEFVNPIQKTIVSWDEFTGRFEAVESVDVRARVSGLLEKIHFEDGQTIKQGDLLFTIDKKPFEAELASAKARLAQAQAAASLARANYERGMELVKRNAIAREEVDVRKGTMDEAEAAQSAAQAQVDIAQLNLDYTEVHSPIDGRISDRFVTVGNLISGGTSQSTLLTSIVSFDPIYCRIDADESSILQYIRQNSGNASGVTGSLPQNIPVQLGVDGDEGYPRKGAINFVDNAFDAGTATLRLRAIVENKDAFLSPGMFARVRLSGKGEYKATLVPEIAIHSRQDMVYLLAVDKDNIVQSVTVKLGPKHGDMRVIESDLPLDTRVIVAGTMMAFPGSEAIPSPAKDAAQEQESAATSE